MKIETTDSTDIFGCVRFGTNGGFGSSLTNKGRPTMISAKYRLKEERRKVLKISLGKLKRIEDPESSLCRSVLINNTMKRLQREAREEKLQRQGIYTPTALTFERVEVKPEPAVVEVVPEASPAPVTVSRKRTTSSGEESDECDVQDVLSHFYMPPTPRLLTSIDDEEESSEPSTKRARLERSEPPTPEPEVRPSTPEPDVVMALNAELPNITERLPSTPEHSESEDEDIDVVSDTSAPLFDTTDFPRPEDDPSLRLRELCEEQRFSAARSSPCGANSCGAQGQVGSVDEPQFSCGHSSIFGELQSVVFHSLIASLES